MTQILRLKQANGIQLQQAARHAHLIDTPNMPYGFGNAYYAEVPSPMQEQVLRKGLQAAGINYLKVEECVKAATEVDRFPKELQVALQNMVKAVKACTPFEVQVEVRVAGRSLYATVKDDPSTNHLALARSAVNGKGFKLQARTLTKVVKIKRTTFVACIEASKGDLQLSVFKGA